jgi:hypothetical protein
VNRSIKFISFSDNATVSAVHHPTISNSFDNNSDDDLLIPLHDIRLFRRNQPKRRRIILKIFIALIIGITMGIILIFFVINKQQSSPSVTVKESTTSTEGLTVALTQQTSMTNRLPIIGNEYD